jgi:cyclopropane fatty-acyl-phospholipid synthase-like methyltransferase
MFEAVGEKWWLTYFDACVRSRLKPDAWQGRRPADHDRDDLFADYRERAGLQFRKYVFPGGIRCREARC